jgi:hypothetical protein
VALRLILPLLARAVTVDRFGTEDEVDLVDVVFDREDVLFVDRDDDDDREEEEREDDP